MATTLWSGWTARRVRGHSESDKGDSVAARPLDNVMIVEIDNWMAAPSAGGILADLGADVIKVEPLSGDPMRGKTRTVRLDDETDEARKQFDYQFDVANRGKRSVSVALDTDQGQEIVHKLCARADVFLCNLLARRQRRFGLDPDTLLAVNPRLVHATLTGYGTTGPEAERPGYDVTAFFGRSGLYDAMREGEDGVVPMARPAQGDYTTGLALVATVLAALRLAESSGEGQVVETSLYETAVWTQASDYAVTAIDHRQLRPRARGAQIIATANRFPCGDGRWIVLNMPEESAWPLLCKTIGREEWLDDERYVDVRSRFRNMEQLVAGIDEAMSQHSRDEWGLIFDDVGVIWGPVLGLHEVVEDPQAEAIGLFPTLGHPTIGDYPTVSSPLRFHTADVGPRHPAPGLGADTRQVLIETGFSAAEIDELVTGGAVADVANDDNGRG
ncbi:MAG: CoA transferase [Actinomycetia bacterium]|nr:CoA transferase [Actinomycetes bacterium]